MQSRRRRDRDFRREGLRERFGLHFEVWIKRRFGGVSRNIRFYIAYSAFTINAASSSGASSYTAGTRFGQTLSNYNLDRFIRHGGSYNLRIRLC